MAVGNNMGNIFIFDMKSDKVPRKFETHGKIVRSLEFTRDSLKLISASDDQHINIIDLYIYININIYIEQIKTMISFKK